MEQPSFLRHRRWPWLALAFAGLLALVAFSEVVVNRETRAIYAEMDRIQHDFEESSRALAGLRSQVYMSAILARDYLLEPSQAEANRQRRQLLLLHASMADQLDKVEGLVDEPDAPAFRRLRQGVEQYSDSVEPILKWSAAQRRARGPEFLRRQVAPRRTTILSLAGEIEGLVAGSLREGQRASALARREFQRRFQAILAATLLAGLLISGAAVIRTRNLERRATALWLETERHRTELQNLSQRLVRAQEEERKSISRELHDQIGQMLTALRMEFGKLEALRHDSGDEFSLRVKEGKSLAEQTLRVVRHLAMGLRPSMLDDLGLAPAVEWQAREFTRGTGIPVHMQIDGELSVLPDGPRTCIYRVLQEALTNCARHAQASEVRVTLHGGAGMLSLTVQDDGAGFDAHRQAGRGLGLIGIQERVRELNGRVTIFSQPRRGTVLRVEVPFAEEESA